jgi:hypothetical protein
MGILEVLGIAIPIEGVAGRIVDLALLLSAVATITMALVELLKSVTLARRFYHRLMIERWLKRGRDFASTRAELLALAAGAAEDAPALYDQSSGKLLAQIQAAANLALDFPGSYPKLYTFLTRADVGAAGAGGDEGAWAAFCRAELAPKRRKPTAAEVHSASQARARLGTLVTRRLDALQTTIDYRWARLNQIVAVAGASLFLLFVLLSQKERMSIFQIVPLSLTGGLLAPFAKDVATALGNLRARRS